MIRKLFIVLFLFSFHVKSQTSLEISLEGYVNNFTSKKVVYGASLYLFQNGTMISKSLTDVNGDYFISGKIDTKVTFDLLVSKPGYVSKKVLLDFEDLKVQNPTLQLRKKSQKVRICSAPLKKLKKNESKNPI